MNSVDYVPLMLIFLTIAFSRIRNNPERDVLLSRQNSLVWKGILAFFVMFSHISPLYSGGIILPYFYNLGFISVGIFFFISGYGLMKQDIRREDYHVGFLKKRFSKILLPYLFVTLIYWLYYYLIGERHSLFYVIDAIVKGDPIVSFSWYIVEILILYLFFYVSMLIFKRKHLAVLIANAVFCILICFCFYKLDFRVAWYRSTYMYVIGLLGALYEGQIVRLMKKYCIYLAIVSGIGLFLTFNNENLFILREICMLLLIVSVCHRFEFHNAFLELSGKISMEIYLIHGLAMKFIRRFINDSNSWISIMYIVVLTFAAAFVLNFIFKKSFSRRKDS